MNKTKTKLRNSNDVMATIWSFVEFRDIIMQVSKLRKRDRQLLLRLKTVDQPKYLFEIKYESKFINGSPELPLRILSSPPPIYKYNSPFLAPINKLHEYFKDTFKNKTDSAEL